MSTTYLTPHKPGLSAVSFLLACTATVLASVAIVTDDTASVAPKAGPASSGSPPTASHPAAVTTASSRAYTTFGCYAPPGKVVSC